MSVQRHTHVHTRVRVGECVSTLEGSDRPEGLSRGAYGLLRKRNSILSAQQGRPRVFGRKAT